MGARLLLGFFWCLHFLPLGLLSALGRCLGRFLYLVARARRAVAQRNLQLCFPQWSAGQRQAVLRAHFEYVGRSILERSVLWYSSPKRLRTLIKVEGDVGLAQRSERAVMWLVPHFVGLDVAGVATQLFQTRKVGSIYQTQSNPVWDLAMRNGRLRFGNGMVFARSEKALPLVRAVRKGWAFFNLPDMDFGSRDAAFVPFFGVRAATLLAPSRMAKALHMIVQPVVVSMLEGGQGYRVQFLDPWPDFPSDDPEADALVMNRWIESVVLMNPAQYLWVHKRFKTRPAGEASVYL